VEKGQRVVFKTILSVTRWSFIGRPSLRRIVAERSGGPNGHTRLQGTYTNIEVGDDSEESGPLCRVLSLSTKKDQSFSSIEAFAHDDIPQATGRMVDLHSTTKVVTVERAL